VLDVAAGTGNVAVRAAARGGLLRLDAEDLLALARSAQ
jgi:ubiquinone/menaquinone biosynthesis C-methylase UbiE